MYFLINWLFQSVQSWPYGPQAYKHLELCVLRIPGYIKNCAISFITSTTTTTPPKKPFLQKWILCFTFSLYFHPSCVMKTYHSCQIKLYTMLRNVSLGIRLILKVPSVFPLFCEFMTLFHVLLLIIYFKIIHCCQVFLEA